jgi:uncharacterized protein involved in cysteine biosynthesis
MIRALLLAFDQLNDPTARRAVAVGIGGAVAAFAILAGVVWWVLFHTPITGLEVVDTTLYVMGGLLVLVLAWFLFPAVAAMVAGLLLDNVAGSVERRHYPHLPAPRHPSWTEAVWTPLRFLGVVLAVNLLALPLYFVPGANVPIYYGVNGYLLGREYFELVAIRRMSPARARTLFRLRPWRPFAAGVIIALMSTVPLLNLLVPVVGCAFMVHVFQGLHGGRGETF